MQAAWAYYPQQHYASFWPAQSLMWQPTWIQEETLLWNPTAVNNTRDCLFNSQGTSSGHYSAWLCKSFWQSPPHKTTSQTGPLWSERKCQTMDRVLPQPQRTASDPWWSQVWICRSPLRGTTRDCPGTPVVPVLHQWLARVHKVFPSQAICRRQPSIQSHQERQWQSSSPKRPFSTRALGEYLADEFQPHQMCSVEDLDKEEEGTSHPVRTARSHSRSGRLQQIPWSYYQGWPVMGDSHSKHSEQANRTLGFLRRNMKDCTKPVKDLTYKAMIRPTMEYSSTVWDPALQTHIAALEQVQRRAARYVCNDYHSRTPGCVTKMIDNLNWEPLEVRRRHERLGMLYRIQHNLVDIPIDRYLQVSDSRTRGPTKFFQERISDATYSNSFFPRTVRDWNKLPVEIVSAASLEEFRSLLWVWSAPNNNSSPVTVYKVLTSFILYIVFWG